MSENEILRTEIKAELHKLYRQGVIIDYLERELDFRKTQRSLLKEKIKEMQKMVED